VLNVYDSAETEVGRPENALPPKLLFLTLNLLVAAILIVASFEASTDRLPTFRFDPQTAWQTTARVSANVGHDLLAVPLAVGRGALAVPRAIGHGGLYVISMLNVPKFIRPAAGVSTPTIPSLPAELASEIAAAPALAPKPVQPYSTGNVDIPTHAAPLVTSSGNTYAWGNCTWWVAILRSRNSNPIPNSWGNATTWASRAADDGYLVDHTPAPGAIMQRSGGLGHVAFVESVDPDGTWHISEMNVVGLDVVSHKSLPLSAASAYNFIHDPS
jgi:surface antigen